MKTRHEGCRFREQEKVVVRSETVGTMGIRNHEYHTRKPEALLGKEMDRAKLRVSDDASYTTFFGFSFELLNNQYAETLPFFILNHGNMA